MGGEHLGPEGNCSLPIGRAGGGSSPVCLLYAEVFLLLFHFLQRAALFLLGQGNSLPLLRGGISKPRRAPFPSGGGGLLFIAHFALVGDAHDGEGVGGGGIGAGPLGTGGDGYLSGTVGALYQYGCRAPFHSARIGCYGGITNDMAFSFDGEHNLVFSQTADVTVIVGNLCYDYDEVGTVGNKFFTHLVGIEANLRGAA